MSFSFLHIVFFLYIKCTLKAAQHYKAGSVVVVPSRAWDTSQVRHLQRKELLSAGEGVRGKKIWLEIVALVLLY